jgi:hypothetical protein
MKRFGSDTQPQSRRYLGLLIVLTLFSTPLRAQKPEKQSWENRAPQDNQWQRLGKLAGEGGLRVYLQDGDLLRGRIQDWSSKAFKFQATGGKIVDVNRADVLRVTKKSRAKGVIWGAVAGAAVGAAALGLGCWLADPDTAATGALIGLGVGAGAGAGMGGAAGMQEVLYRARPALN